MIGILCDDSTSCKVACDNNDCYMTPIKDLFWLAETSLHWLWQILMSNSDELKTGNITDRELNIDWTKSSPGDIGFVTATWELKIDIATLTDFLCIFHR